MKDVLTLEQLNNLDKSALVALVMQKDSQLEELNQKMDRLLEQIANANNALFGRKTEAGLIIENQISMFNEIEALADGSSEPEIEVIVPSYKRRKRAGKRNEDLSGFPVKVIEHTLSEEELQVQFPNGFSKLPDEIYRKLEYYPATYEVLEHHIAVYKDKSSVVFRRYLRSSTSLTVEATSAAKIT